MILKPKPKITLLAALLSLAGMAAAQGAEVFDNARSTLERWVQTRQIIARERTTWLSEDKTLTESISLLKNEIESLQQAIEDAETDINTQDDTQKTLRAEIGEAEEAVKVVEAAVPVFEKKLLELSSVFPVVFTEKVAMQMRRIPDPDSDREVTVSLDERVQNIISILEHIEYFNKTINLSSELRETDGETIEVKTIYIGLGQAYFVDEGMTTAGYGYPVIGKGWEWVSMPEIARAVTDTILVADNRKPAVFVSLPVDLQE